MARPPRIEILTEKTVVGKHLTMSYANNRTRELWQGFMPRRQEIQNPAGPELYSLEIYDPDFFTPFQMEKEFEKWAAIEVNAPVEIPEGMEDLTVPEGLYAVFIHRGPASKGQVTYDHIFGTWLPNSGYVTDNRPHFAVMGEKYKHEDPDSEEEIWIPVKLKT